MRRTLHFEVFGYALSARATLGGELLKPTIDVNDMRVVVSLDVFETRRAGVPVLRTSSLPAGARSEKCARGLPWRARNSLIALALGLAGCVAGASGPQPIRHGLGEHWDATRFSVDDHACIDSRLVCDRIDPRFFCRCVP